MDHVSRVQTDLEWCANWHVQLVGSDHTQPWVFEFPPPLVADDSQRLRRGRSRIDTAHRLDNEEEHHCQRERRRHRPGDLQRAIAVRLRWLSCIAGPRAKAEQGNREPAQNEHQQKRRDRQIEVEETGNLYTLPSDRIEGLHVRYALAGLSFTVDDSLGERGGVILTRSGGTASPEQCLRPGCLRWPGQAAISRGYCA